MVSSLVPSGRVSPLRALWAAYESCLPLSSPPSGTCGSCLSFPAHALVPPGAPSVLFLLEAWQLEGRMPLPNSCQPLNRGLSLFLGPLLEDSVSLSLIGVMSPALQSCWMGQ